MSTWRTEAQRLLAEARALTPPSSPLLDQLRRDPAELLVQGGMDADPWQVQVLRRAAPRTLLLCGRQCGKSTTAAALALRAALLEPPALVLLLAPTLRQAGELYRDKVVRLFNDLGRPVQAVRQSALTLTLANGSRIVALPGDEKNVRCYSNVSLIIIDEAARVRDSLYSSVRPMLAVSRGRLVALSTPDGQRGWFHAAWHGSEVWDRVRITADQCPRIPRAFLEEERRELGERWYAQEYCCDFARNIDSIFSFEDIAALSQEEVKPLFAPGGF
jgi:hypothetical protein